MNDYIHRKSLLKALEEQRTHAPDQSFKIAMNTAEGIVEQQPGADVEEVRHGTWLPLKQTTHWADTGTISTDIVGFYCSLCGAEEKFRYRYCHCGARMDGGKEE